MNLPLSLRLYWVAFLLTALALLALTVGPRVEATLFPIRVDQRVEEVRRDGDLLHFVWVSDKVRMAPSGTLDVALITPNDRFEVTLFNDRSADGEPACTNMIPWSRSRAVGIGPHRQHYCVEIPRTVARGERIDLVVVAHYRGFLGLWDHPVAFPPIADVPPG